MKGGYLGPTYNEEIRKILNNKSYKFNYFEDEQLIKKVADLIASGNVIGWFQGRLNLVLEHWVIGQLLVAPF